MELNARQRQLRERDVRKLSPELNANTFLQLYLESNFPQTSAHPSQQQQLQAEAGVNNQDDILKLMKKPLSGTKYDNPGGF